MRSDYKWIIFIAITILTIVLGIIQRGTVAFGSEMVFPVAVFVLMFLVGERKDESRRR